MRTTRARHRNARLLVSLMLGVVVGAGTTMVSRLDVGIALAWAVGVVAYCIWTWARLWRLTPEETASHAREEDPGRAASDAILLLAAGGSVVGVGFVLAASQRSDVLAAVVGAGAVVASWLLVHTVYGIRYADLYFSTPKPPIEFGDDPPVYSDFAYIAFCISISYAISDTDLHTTRLRKTVIWHSLLSYFLGTVVLACTINVIVGLAS
ncbi:MAG TPA: DUF1345 domain-containing protein [Arachnia sp.]|nr:DUF1345 domain-containing protein [Arachnia sp.]HMT87479.1 DUF1345 domain-containing protein [Arachnia sp.]